MYRGCQLGYLRVSRYAQVTLLTLMRDSGKRFVEHSGQENRGSRTVANTNGHVVYVDEETYALLQKAKKVSRIAMAQLVNQAVTGYMPEFTKRFPEMGQRQLDAQ